MRRIYSFIHEINDFTHGPLKLHMKLEMLCMKFIRLCITSKVLCITLMRIHMTFALICLEMRFLFKKA
jgi:hypothetical protein